MSANHSRVRGHNVSHSRPRFARDQSFIPQAEALTMPDGQVGEQTAELLQDLVHTHHHEDITLVDEESIPEDPQEVAERLQRAQLPWWKRPTPVWLLAAIPLTAIATSATMAPRIDIYTILACNVYKPEYMRTNATANSGFNTAADTPLSLCASDPVVQEAVAKLSTAMTTSMGILGCLTTAWWSSFSDRTGRTRVMGLSMLGLLATDFNFILVAKYARWLPGNYWFLILGPLIEGSLGGMSAGIAALHAYIADTTEPSANSRTFSLFLGLMFTGMSIGPTLGGLLIRLTSYTLSVFYLSTSVHLLYAFLVWFILPESLTRSQMRLSREKRSEELNKQLEAHSGRIAYTLALLKKPFGFLKPLAILAPAAKNHTNSLKNKKDWNLVFIVAAYGCTISLIAAHNYTFQYAAFTFGWTSETIGYWLSIIGAARAIHLTIILPIVIKLFKPAPIRLPVEPSDPLLPESGSSSSDPSPSKTKMRKIHSPSFDLALARISLIIEIIAYILVGLSPSPGFFTIFTVIACFGSGFGPAINSVALELYTRGPDKGKEVGRLFGAFSVIQALSSQIIGPAFFGLTYMSTVSIFPRAIFFVSVTAVTVSFILLCFVRAPKDTDDDIEDHAMAPEAWGREETLVDADDVAEEDRGRQHNRRKAVPA